MFQTIHAAVGHIVVVEKMRGPSREAKNWLGLKVEEGCSSRSWKDVSIRLWGRELEAAYSPSGLFDCIVGFFGLIKFNHHVPRATRKFLSSRGGIRRCCGLSLCFFEMGAGFGSESPQCGRICGEAPRKGMGAVAFPGVEWHWNRGPLVTWPNTFSGRHWGILPFSGRVWLGSGTGAQFRLSYYLCIYSGAS